MNKKIIKKLKKTRWFNPFLFLLSKGKIEKNTTWFVNQEMDLGKSDLVVVCVVRNGEIHVEEFIRHHFNIGAKYIVFLDNGSNDNTIEIAKKFENVIILKNVLSYGKYNKLFKYFLFDKFCRIGWGLIIDIDERFEYPFHDRIPINKFLQYLELKGYSAVTCQMLDLYSCEKMSQWPKTGKEISSQCVWYDNSFLIKKKTNVGKTNVINNDKILGIIGGIRSKVFDLECFLTKHPLLNYSCGARHSVFSDHLCHNGNIADISCLLKHYKFESTFYEYCKICIEENVHFNDSIEYKTYMRKIKDGSFNLETPGKKLYKNIHQLIDEEFLIVSEEFKNYVALAEKENG